MLENFVNIKTETGSVSDIKQEFEEEDPLAIGVDDLKQSNETQVNEAQHDPLVKYNCDKCHKRFSWKKLLVKHIKDAHDNVRNNCEKCDKTFSTKGNLNKHIKSIHANVRNNCDKCKKSFSSKSELKLHIQSVHEEIRHNCNMCKRFFIRKDALQLHIKNVHDHIQINCDKCDKSFTTWKYLNKHIKIAHVTPLKLNTIEDVKPSLDVIEGENDSEITLDVIDIKEEIFHE